MRLDSARIFRNISENRIKRDSFTSVAKLELAIDLYIAEPIWQPVHVGDLGMLARINATPAQLTYTLRIERGNAAKPVAT
jgi:hypothetical protein